MKKNGRDQIDSPPPLAVASVKTRKAEIEIDRQETRKGRERVRKKSSPEMSSPPCRRRDAVAGMPLLGCRCLGHGVVSVSPELPLLL
uniref:Uncharacterized protein n=1 Tax=Fagus sylvatica TaxID=28930 RepID=A0A2N9J7L9_FAGSY